MARPFVERYTEDELTDKIFDAMDALEIKYAPTWTELKSYDCELLKYIKGRYTSYTNFAKCYKLQTQAQYRAMARPIKEKPEVTAELKEIMEQHGLEYMPTKTFFYSIGNKKLFNRISHIYGGLQLAAAHLGVKYSYGGGIAEQA